MQEKEEEEEEEGEEDLSSLRSPAMMGSQPLLKALELNQPIKFPPHAAEMPGPV